MSKQHLEGILREILKLRNDIWFLKLQTFPDAHRRNPADFIVLTDIKKYLIECKECKNNRFELSRLTQLIDLLLFSEYKNNYSYVLICFWNGRRKTSDYYFIEINEYVKAISSIKKKSLNKKDFEKLFEKLSYEMLIEKIRRL